MVQLNTFKMFWLMPFTFHIILSEISRQTQNFCTDLIAASSFVKISTCEFASGDDGGDNKIFFLIENNYSVSSLPCPPTTCIHTKLLPLSFSGDGVLLVCPCEF